MGSEEIIDVVIITALKEESDAMVAYLNCCDKITTKGRTFFRGSISNSANGEHYNVIVLPTYCMGNVSAALATHHAIFVWNPTHIILGGIAGGVKDPSRMLGDIVIGEQILHYEPGKSKPSKTERRNQVYRPAKIMLDACKRLDGTNWALAIKAQRPDGTTGRTLPMLHFGVVASGEKVVTDPNFIEEIHSEWAQLIAVEMEGAGSAIAAYESAFAPGVLLIKGICDWADPEKNDAWHKYAAESSAALINALLRSRPFESKPKPQAVRINIPPYSGRTKIQVCKRLINDWEDLADFFDIPLDQRARFSRGREPQGVWEWLEQRKKLSFLRDALQILGRDDLIVELE